MLGTRWALVLKGAYADRLVVGTAFLVVLLSATLVAAIPIYSNAVAESSLRARLARAPVTEANVQATVDLFQGNAEPGLDGRVTGIARDVFSATGVSIFRSGESEPFAAGRRTVVYGFADDLPRHARLLAGRWPGGRGSTLEVAVPDAAARQLGLRVGREVNTRSRVNQRHVEARVVGIYRAERPSSVYWWTNPLSASGSGPLMTTRRAFFAAAFGGIELRWRLQPEPSKLTLEEATPLRRKLAALPARLNEARPEGEQFTLDTNLVDILDAAKRSLRLARAGVLVPSIQLALLAIYGLFVTAALLIERRLITTESLRLRGATTRQLMAFALREAVLVAVPAVALAPWLAAAALQALNYAGPLADIGLHLDPRVNATAYLLAVAAGAVCVAALVLPVVRARRLAVVGDRERTPLARFAQRTRLDLVLVALALLGYWQLRRYHGVLVSNRGSLGIDPFLVAAPAVLLLAGAVLSLRLVPLAAALVERYIPSTQGAVGALGFWQLARRPRAYARSVLLLVIAVAIGVFAATYSRTWHRSQVDQARYAAGADLRVEPTDSPATPDATELSSAYRALGVHEALPAAAYSFDLGRFADVSGNLLALDARRASRLVRVRDDFASRPLPQLLEPLAAGRGRLASLPLPGRPTRLALSLRYAATGGALPADILPFRAPSVRPTLFLYLVDADGVVYLYKLGELPLRKEKRFSLELPQRVIDGRLTGPRYPLALAALELDVDVPYIKPSRASFLVRSLEVARGDGVWRRVRLAGPAWRVNVKSFKLPYELPRAGGVSAVDGSVRMRFTTGSFLFVPTAQRATAQIYLRPGRDSLPATPSVLASDGFLRATDTTVGDVFPLELGPGSQPVRIVGSFHRFPTLDPAAPAVVADLPSYLALSFVHGEVVQPSQWWLAADDDHRVAERVRAAPFRSLDVSSRSERERALLEDPVPLGVIGALALGFVVAAAFGVLGFAAGTAATARARAIEFAVLRSLGLRTRQLSGWVGLESALVVVLSLIGGAALGLVVSRLVLPYVALSASGAAPVPPVELAVPWTTILVLELVLLGALVVISAAQIVRVRGLRLAPVLRSGEGTLAS